MIQENFRELTNETSLIIRGVEIIKGVAAVL